MVARLLGNEHKAADAMQEIMIKLWDKRLKIEKHPNPNGFVFLTARNYCLDLLKKGRVKTQDTTSIPELEATEKTSSDLEWRELKVIVDSILSSLPTQQKEVMIMRDIDGMEFNEISELMDLKVSHIRVLLSRARKTVANELKTKYSYEN